MIELGKGFDGTIEKAISSTEKLKGLPEIVQKYMMWGDYKSGFVKKIDGSNFGTDENGKDIQNYVAQISNLDKAQRKAIISVTELGDDSEKTIEKLIKLTQTGSRINGKVFEASLKSAGNSEINQGDINSLMNALGMKNGDNYALPDTNEVKKNLNMWAKAAENADAKTRLMNAGIIESTKNGYAMTDSFKKMIGIEEVDGAVKVGLTAKQLALNAAMQIGKQLLFSLGVTAAAFVASKIIDYISNLKTRSEELVDAMNDSHDAAEQATKDVEEIQSKIDELNDSLEAAGVKKIEDIVDPTERERLQTVNDMLQAQLELKKQLEKDANDKANADTSAVVNDKTEKSIVKKKTVYLDVNGEPTDNPTEAVTTFDNIGEDITKTESLQEHTTALNELIDKRRELATAGQEDTQEYKDNEAAITSETEKVEELSSAVSEQMDGYETDAESFAKYKDEYVTGTNTMTAATKALANAQDNTGIDTTNLDIFLEKVKQIKNDIDNGDSQQSDWKTFNGLDAFSGMTGEAIINIDKDSSHQTETETAALEKLHKTADENKISFESLIDVFESFGLVQISNSATADDYADKLEKTMGVIDNIQSAYKACSSAVEEYNQYGYMSVDSLQALLQMDDQYLNTLELVNGKLQVNQSAYADLLATQYAEAQMEAISQAISELNAIAKGDAAEKAETFTEATKDEKNKLTALCPALKDATVGTGELAAALAAAQGAANGEDADAIQAKIDGVMNALNTRLKLIGNNMSAAMNGAADLRNQLDGFSNSSNKAADSSKTLLDAWSTLTSAMKEYNEQGYITFQTLKSLTDLEDKYSSMLKKNDVTGQLEIRTDDFYKLMKAELKEAQIKGDGASEAQYNKILEWTNRNIKNQTMSYWDLVAAIEGYSAALSGAKEITDTFKDAWDNGKTVKEKQEKSRAGALDYEGTEAQSSALQDLMKYSEYDPELIGKAFNKETGKIDLSGDMLKTAVTESLKQQAAAARTEGGAAAEAIATSYEKSAENIENDVISVQDYFDGLGSTIEEVSSKIDELQSAYTDLEDITSEYNTYGGLSVDSLQKLLTMSPEYLACLEMNGDQLVFNRDKMQELLILQLESRKEFLASKKETEDQAQIIQAIIDSIRTNGVDAIKGMGTEAERVKSILSDMKDIFSFFLDLIESANSKKDSDLKLWGEAMTEDIDKRIDALNKQKEALQEANDEEERAITLAKLKAELEKARTQRTVRKLTSNGYEWVADESAVKEAQDNLNDQQREWRKEDAEKAIDDQIDKLNELKDKYSEIISLIGTDWDDYNKKLKYASEIADMTFTEMEGRVDVFKGNVLASMQAANPISTIKNIIGGLESLISTLEKVGNVLDKLDGGSGNGGITTLWNKITNLFNGKNTNNTQTAFGNFWNNLSQVGRNGVNKLQEVIFGGWNKITSGTSGFLSNVGNFFNGAQNKISTSTSLLFSDIGSFFSQGFSSLVGLAQNGLGSVVSVVGSLFTPIANGAMSIGSAISSGIVSFFPSIFMALGTLVSTVGAAMSGMLMQIATALASIPVVGWIAAAVAVAGAVALIASIAATASKTSKTTVDQPKPSFKAKKYAKGSKTIDKNQLANVDEQGSELVVRQPESGRYTYLETGDGVVPADITSRLFEMGGNPDEWFNKQLAKHAALSNVQNHTVGGAVSVGDIYIQNPVGNTNELAKEIVLKLPNALLQYQSKR